MPVDVVISEISVQALADMIGQAAKCEDILRAIKFDSVLKGKALAVVDLLCDCAPIRHSAQNYTGNLPALSRELRQ